MCGRGRWRGVYVLVRTANVYAVQWGAVHLSYLHVRPLIIITECT